MLDWLIIGGGVHGTMLSRALVTEGGVARAGLRVLDPWHRPLHRWRECAESTGMEFLRSPDLHHLDGPSRSLLDFARARGGEASALFRGAWRRPSRTLFEDHADAVIARSRLADLRLEGTARSIRPRRRGGLEVETDRGALAAARVLLAIGAGDRPPWPRWAAELRRRGAPIRHLLEPGAATPERAGARRVVVVGGGLSALEAALAAARRRPGSVALVSRHRPRVHAFDTDPDWLGPRRMRLFRRERDPARRRRLIAEARHSGSVPADAAAELETARRRGSVRFVLGSIRAARWNGKLELEAADDGRPLSLAADLVLLATGFGDGCPAAPALDGLVEAFGPRRAACGFPRLDASLQWYPGLFVSGPLAELELGPTARNIHGARLAARRLLRVAA